MLEVFLTFYKIISFEVSDQVQLFLFAEKQQKDKIIMETFPRAKRTEDGWNKLQLRLFFTIPFPDLMIKNR